MDQNFEKMISPFTKSLIVFFAILLTLSLILMLFSATLQNTIFSSKFYEKVFEKQNLYELLPAIMSESIQNNLSNQNQPSDSQNLLFAFSSEQLKQLFDAVLPENYLKTQVNNGIASVLSYVNLQTSDLSVMLDLHPVKEALLGANGESALLHIINTLPDCTDAQIQSFIKSQGSGIGLSMCNPPEAYLNIIIPIAVSSLHDYANLMPNEINLMSNEQSNNFHQLTASLPFRAYVMYRQILNLIPWLVITLTLLIILLTLRSWKVMLSSLGIPLIISGIFGSLASIFVMLVKNILPQTIHTGNSFMEPLISGAFGEAFRQFSLFGLIIGAGAFTLGLIFTIISKSLKR